MQPVHDILIASAETLCELINFPWVSFSTVLFKASIHSKSLHTPMLGAPGWQGAPPWPARGSAIPPGRYRSFAVGREPLHGHCCSSLAYTEALASFVSVWVWANTENSCPVDQDHDKAGSHRAVCGRNQVITIKKSNYWVIKCARCQKLHEAEYK